VTDDSRRPVADLFQDVARGALTPRLPTRPTLDTARSFMDVTGGAFSALR
jgi:hypothetical protein